MALPAPQPLAIEELGLAPVDSEVDASAWLSLCAPPGSAQTAGRRVTLLVADGVDCAALREVQRLLLQAGAGPRVGGMRLGRVMCSEGQAIEIQATIEALASVLWGAIVLPGGMTALAVLNTEDKALTFLKDQSKQGRPILAMGGVGRHKLSAAGVAVQPNSGGAASAGNTSHTHHTDPAPIFSQAADDCAACFIAAVGATPAWGA